MTHSIVTKMAAVIVAVVMNGVVLGGVSYLFDAQAHRSPEAAKLEQTVSAERAALGIV